MRKLVAFLCSGLAATLGFADTTGDATETTTTTENTSGNTTTQLCVGFSFNNSATRGDQNYTTSAAKDEDGSVVLGTSEALEKTEWFCVDNYKAGSVTNIFPFTVEEASSTEGSGGTTSGETGDASANSEEATDGTSETTEEVVKPTITWSCANVYSTAQSYSRSTTFLDGYLDDGGNGISINVTGFTNRYASADYKYDVIIYFATDSNGLAFIAPFVNGTQYTYDSANPSTAKAGSASFGNSTQLSAGKAQYGVNALRVRGLTGDLTISSTRSGSPRACIAAFQIVPANYTSIPTLTIGGEGKTEVQWSTNANWDPATAPTSVGHANINLEGDATLDLDTDIEVTNKLTVASTTTESRTLTLKKSDATKTTTIGDLVAYDGVSLAVADTNAYKAVLAATTYPQPLTVKAKIDSSDLPFASLSAGRIFAGGAGSADSPRAFSCSGGSITLSGDETFYLNGANSDTQTTVLFDGATVDYGSDNLTIGKATYLLTNATVTAQRFILSDGGDGRSTVITLAGTSKVTVTGNDNQDKNTASALFGHWKGDSTFTLKDDAQFLAPSAQVLVGKTRFNHTININGGLFSANGIALAGYATGSNTLNLNGGTLALGEVGLSGYPSETQEQSIDTSRSMNTMAVNVTGDATMQAKAATFPIWHPVTVAADTTLTLDKADDVDTATFSFNKTFSCEGSTVAIKAGVNVDFGEGRPAKITVANASSKISFQPVTTTADSVTIACEGLTSLENVTIYGTDGTKVTTSSYAKLEDGVLTLLPIVPTLECEGGDINFETASNWSGSSVPTSGNIFIRTVADTTSTVTIGANHSYANIYVFGTGTVVLKGAGVLTLSGSVTFREAAQMTMAANVFSEGRTVSIPSGTTLTLQNLGTFTHVITGAGKVKTVGDVQFTKNSSFTGGLIVTAGTASVASNAAKKGFGGEDADGTAGAITVEDGGCLNLANTQNRSYALTITGKGVATTNENGVVTYSGALTNTGDPIPTSAMQTRSITLAGDALITAKSGSNWGLLASGYGATTLKLAGYTLTKQGAGEFFVCNVTTSTSGAIAVKEGTLSTVSEKGASTLNSSEVRMFGTSILSLGVALNGVTKVRLSPSEGGITLNNINNLTSSATIVLNGAGFEGNEMTASAGETVTLVKGTANTITDSLIASSNIALGSRFAKTEDGTAYDLTYSTDGTTLKATLQDPTKFFHFDFNGETMTASETVADDSVYNINAWTYYNGKADVAWTDDGDTIKSSGRTGSSTWVRGGTSLYWLGTKDVATSTAQSTGPLDSCGALTITTVARLKFADSAVSPIWCLGKGSNGANSSTIVLRVVDDNTVAAVAFDGGGKDSYGRELVRVSGIENLTTQYHFFALVVTGEESRLYVDRLAPTVSYGARAPLLTMEPYGQLGAILGNSNVYSGVNGTGFYLDDFQVYDAILSDTEIQALRREFCPDPFFILVK